MKTVEAYQKVIGLILSGQVNNAEVVKNLAQKNPTLFLECCSGIITMDQKIAEIYTTEGIIPAIKYHRSESRMGLKESKDYVENLAERLKIKKPDYNTF